MFTVIDHEHFFCPDGERVPHEAHPGGPEEARNEIMRFDAIAAADGDFLVWDVWNMVVVEAQLPTWEEACRRAKAWATW